MTSWRDARGVVDLGGVPAEVAIREGRGGIAPRAEVQARWRRKHPDRAVRVRARSRARQRAATRLARLFPDEFGVLFAEECAVEGVSVTEAG